MAECTPGYHELAAALNGGLDCATAHPIASFTAPWRLTNWTLPVVEALMVLLAVSMLLLALNEARNKKDPTLLGLWCACVVYVFVLEPPLYFPDRFGMLERLGMIFAHNRFSLQFLYDRLPLYIIALYPGLGCLVYVLVRQARVIERCHPLVAASSYGLVFQAFYEVFDHIGPQLRWWEWNTAAPSNALMLASVPLSSMAFFACASPFGLALLTILLLQRPAARSELSRSSVAARAVAIGVLAPIAMVLFALPSSVFGPEGYPSEAGQAVVLWAEIAIVAVVGYFGLVSQKASRDQPALQQPAALAVLSALLYLATFAVLWAAALPSYFHAVQGRTAEGTPTGSLLYAACCMVGSLAFVVIALRTSRPAVRRDDAGLVGVSGP